MGPACDEGCSNMGSVSMAAKRFSNDVKVSIAIYFERQERMSGEIYCKCRATQGLEGVWRTGT